MSAATGSGAALWAACFALGVLPVLAFLLALVVLDSYKLIRLRAVLLLIAAGAGVAAVCMLLNPRLMAGLGLEAAAYSRYVAPLVEEALKGAVVLTAIRRRRIGFLVDAAIWGFALGAGFAAIENASYFVVLADPNPTLWMIRGFGTAIMHGGATSIFAVGSKLLTERFDSTAVHLFVPGFFLAALIHSFFNHFYLSPDLSTLALVVGLPALFLLVFRVSERATQRWLGVGFDSDQELLAVMNSGELATTRVGRYLRDLRQHFPKEIVADMICLIRLHLELSIRAKGVLLMQKAGFTAPTDPEVERRFQELKYLERSIGRTGLMALEPIFTLSSRDLWQLHVLGRR